MADQDPEGEREKRHIGGELVIPIAALLFTIYYFTTIIDVPWTAQVSAFFVGTVLIICIAIFAVRAALMIRRGNADLAMTGLIAPISYVPKRLILLGLTIGYVYFIHLAGFTLTTFVFLTAAMLTLNDGRHKGLVLLLCAVLAIGGWLLFVVVFETRFPPGPFEAAMHYISPGVF